MINLLCKGKTNATTRIELNHLCGEDRQMRRQLEILKNENPICNEQDGTGYYIAETYREAQKQYLTNQSIIKKLTLQNIPLLELMKELQDGRN